MIKNYLTVIFRSFWRFRLYSLLNVLGLAIALAVAMLIFMYVRKEVSYDKHFEKADRIYRVVNYTYSKERQKNWANGAPVMADEIMKFIPEIENVTRMRPVQDAVLEFAEDSLNKVSHMETGGFFADSTFFEIFDVNIIQGDRENPLNRPGSIVLTESLTRKFFGVENPLGKTISTMGMPFTITAICEDFPETQHFSPSYFIDWQTFIDIFISINLRDVYYARGWQGVYIYILLDEHANAADLDGKLMDFRIEYFSDRSTREETIADGQYVLQPLRDIHLRSHLEQEVEANGNIVYVIVSTLAAIFILIIAGVNYVNLATVKTFKRIKEVGIRKVNGALRHQLVFQFIGESLFLAIISGILSVLMMDFMLPLFNRITENNLDSIEMLSLENSGMLFILVIMLGLVSGLYPSFFASNASPINALTEMKDPGSITNRIRVGLVVLQFTFSIFMIFGTIIVYRQMNYFLNKDMGFDKEYIIALTLNGGANELAQENPALFKEEINKLAFIKNTSLISTLPGDRFSVEGLYPEVVRDDEIDPSIRFLRVDEDFIPLMGVEILQGRNLKRSGEDQSEFLLNESAVRILQLENPTGVKASSMLGQTGEIVGVIRDFNYASLHQIIEPLVLEFNYGPEFRSLWYQHLLLRFTPGDLSGKVEAIEKRMQELAGEYVMNFTFIEENINKNYKSEMRMKELLQAFALFAIFISCLGLFGLSAFSAQLRTKEMGIRKAMGASILKIAARLSREFLIYIIFALIIALPLGYYFMNGWLNNFAYHIDIHWWEFMLSAVLALAITVLSVGYQALRTGMANPVNSLRYE